MVFHFTLSIVTVMKSSQYFWTFSVSLVLDWTFTYSLVVECNFMCMSNHIAHPILYKEDGHFSVKTDYLFIYLLFVFVCLFVCLFVFICLFIYLSIYLFIYLFIYCMHKKGVQNWVIKELPLASVTHVWQCMKYVSLVSQMILLS